MVLLFKLGYNEDKNLFIPVFASDSLYSKVTGEANFPDPAYYSRLEDGIDYIDSLFDGNKSWQLVSLPVADIETDSFFSILFPNLFADNELINRLATESITLSYDDEPIPGLWITGGISAGSGTNYRYTSSNKAGRPGSGFNNIYPYSFPQFQLQGALNRSGVLNAIVISFGVIPENCVSENGIDLSQFSEKMLPIISISIFQYRENPFQFKFTGNWGRSSYNINESTIMFWANKSPVIFDDDPFNPGGSSGTGGGGGDFDNTSTPIDIPSLPSISASSTGFISLYNPTLSQLNELASYLWSDLFEIDGWKKLFANPMDSILGLSILPVAVPSGGLREVKVGNIGTGISLSVASSQFVEVDCGSIDVNEYWGAYLDYEPYTQAQIFLPYIGTRPISVDDIMGKTVRVVYHVDILTGACCCFVKCGESVLYTYNGQCSIPIPITSANYTSVVNGVISVAASVGSLVATGGASAPTAIPAIATSVVNQMKPQIEKSGSISGSAGVLNMQIPYLILIRPRQALPSRQNEFIGYPSLITVQLTELSGYTEVQSIHLENIPATQEELAEIQSLLEGGVIF